LLRVRQKAATAAFFLSAGLIRARKITQARALAGERLFMRRACSVALRNELLMPDGKIFIFAFDRAKTRGIRIERPLLIPLVQYENRVPDFRSRLAQFNHQAPSLRLALSFAASATQEVHGGSLLSEFSYR
jgi:hypothetical protein